MSYLQPSHQHHHHHYQHRRHHYNHHRHRRRHHLQKGGKFGILPLSDPEHLQAVRLVLTERGRHRLQVLSLLARKLQRESFEGFKNELWHHELLGWNNDCQNMQLFVYNKCETALKGSHIKVMLNIIDASDQLLLLLLSLLLSPSSSSSSSSSPPPPSP